MTSIPDSHAQPERARFYYLDNLRTFLVVLVVLMHIAVLYSGLSGVARIQDTVNVVMGFFLVWFTFALQAFFMSSFTLISGFFTPGAYDRKGVKLFIFDRLLRLGVPLLFYDLVINPLVLYITQMRLANSLLPFSDFYREYLASFRTIGSGPTWYLVMLLLFSLGYAAWRQLRRSRTNSLPGESSFPRNSQILIFILLLALTTYLVRVWFFYGDSATFFSLKMSHLPYYIAFFILGLAASPRSLLSSLPDRTGKAWGWAAIGLILVYPAVIFIGGFGRGNANPWIGGLNIESLLFVVWETALCVSANLGLFSLFRRRYDQTGGLARAMAESTYTVYLIHVPIIFICRQAFYDLPLLPLIKLALTTLISLPACFLISHYVIRRIPGVKRILF